MSEAVDFVANLTLIVFMLGVCVTIITIAIIAVFSVLIRIWKWPL